MILGVNFCRRNTARRKSAVRVGSKICIALLSLLVVIGLLFVAPQWLLVALVLLLSAALLGVLLYCRLL